MNGKVNAVTLGLANLFTKRQVEQATQGVVKSINGVTPDENGEVTENFVSRVLFVDGSAIFPGNITAPGYDAVQISKFFSDANLKALVFERLIMGTTPLKTVLWKGYSVINNTITRIHFGENYADVIINSGDNTITLDPDWVAPEPTATQSYVTQAIAPIQEDVGNLESTKVSLPVTNSTPNYGTAGQFAVSDGNGGITWKTLVEAEGVDY